MCHCKSYNLKQNCVISNITIHYYAVLNINEKGMVKDVSNGSVIHFLKLPKKQKLKIMRPA